ncbi:CpsD/CapB family tyrosine-protein kinase [Adlercreutzia sp. ZJ242]|uniref:CpsD/CapB family tyrosine-protein kinase n=1 Tax=Adlercreutzia sp. ZJ242 TaxID=2709409 RepID=UPI0013EA9BD5|nr:CpsD/CapB family tyrosine-protein kinase [Adlercreutzia sp. ZJ242]
MGKKNHKKIGQFEVPGLRNASQTLLANIRFASVDERVKTLVVTSSTPDEGKTTVSSNLALAIASAGHKVLIVESDMRRRCLASMLELHPRNGIYAVLSGDAQLDDVIVPTKYDNLYFMDAEPNIPSPPDLLSTKRFSALVDKLRETYDFVVFDAPPLGAFVDAALISNLVDGTILVVRERRAKRAAIANSIQQLQAANARILGVVMTFTNEADSNYYYAYYNEQGERVKKDDSKAPALKATHDLIDDDIDAWARRAGIETTQRDRETRERREHAHEQRAEQREVQREVREARSTGNGNRRPQSNNPRSNNPRANAVNAAGSYGYAGRGGSSSGNPFTPGAFKPATPDGKQPRHKSRRI